MPHLPALRLACPGDDERDDTAPRVPVSTTSLVDRVITRDGPSPRTHP